MRVSAILIAAVLVVILAVGCGGSSGSSSESSSSGGQSGTEGSGESSTTSSEKPQGPPLSKKAYVKEGDAICGGIPTNYNKELEALNKELKKKGQKPTKSEETLKAAVPPIYVAVEEFQQLSPPKGEEQKTEAIIAALEGAAKGLEEKPESELSGPKSPFAEFQKLTKAYGFQFCSSL